jgi:hypothetical protein
MWYNMLFLTVHDIIIESIGVWTYKNIIRFGRNNYENKSLIDTKIEKLYTSELITTVLSKLTLTGLNIRESDTYKLYMKAKGESKDDDGKGAIKLLIKIMIKNEIARVMKTNNLFGEKISNYMEYTSANNEKIRKVLRKGTQFTNLSKKYHQSRYEYTNFDKPMKVSEHDINFDSIYVLINDDKSIIELPSRLIEKTYVIFVKKNIKSSNHVYLLYRDETNETEKTKYILFDPNGTMDFHNIFNELKYILETDYGSTLSDYVPHKPLNYNGYCITLLEFVIEIINDSNMHIYEITDKLVSFTFVELIYLTFGFARKFLQRKKS